MITDIPNITRAEDQTPLSPLAPVDLLNLDRRELTEQLTADLRLEAFRTRQLMQWIYRRRIRDFTQMSDIAKPVRETLGSRYLISRPEKSIVQESKDGTRKYLFTLADGSQVETVLIRQPTRWTLCVSSQVGCAIRCSFCRTGLMGLKRNLETAEILGQVLAVQDEVQLLTAEGVFTGGPQPFQNIVFMGMGEPLHNLANVSRAVRILNDEYGLSISGRKITVSTSGLVPAIKKFSESGAQANLAVSLNATTDEVRTEVIPINKKYPLALLLETLREYPLKKGRRITIEYVMLHGVNDTDEDLRRLPKLLRGIPVKVNLIPYNVNAQLGYKTPPQRHVLRWQEFLLGSGLNSTIRWSKGIDIDAACGQLATKVEQGVRGNLRTNGNGDDEGRGQETAESLSKT